MPSPQRYSPTDPMPSYLSGLTSLTSGEGAAVADPSHRVVRVEAKALPSGTAPQHFAPTDPMPPYLAVATLRWKGIPQRFSPTAKAPRYLSTPTHQPMLWRLPLTVAAFLAIVVATFNLSPTTNNSLAIAACYVAVIGGLSMLTGISGQISLGNGAFMGFGSYATAIWITHHPSQPVWFAIILAGIFGAAIGAIVGLPATKLRGPYLAGATLAFGAAFSSTVSYFTSWTGGDQGLALPQLVPPTWLVNHSNNLILGPQIVANNRYWAWVAWGGALIILLLLSNLLTSRFGRQFRAVRDDDVAAELQGINVARTRVTAFAISSMCAAVGGGLLAVVQASVSPNTFNTTLSIGLLASMVIGGTGTMLGAVWGGLLWEFSNNWIASLQNHFNISPTGNVGSQLQPLIFGGALILVMLLAPGGIQRQLSMVKAIVLRYARRGMLDR